MLFARRCPVTGRRCLSFNGEGNCVADRVAKFGLKAQGIDTSAQLHWNLTTAPLVEHAVARGEGQLSKDGALVVRTGKHTGRSAQDRFIVRNGASEGSVWWSKTNRPLAADAFD